MKNAKESPKGTSQRTRYNNILLEIEYSNFLKFKICCVQLKKLLIYLLMNCANLFPKRKKIKKLKNKFKEIFCTKKLNVSIFKIFF